MSTSGESSSFTIPEAFRRIGLSEATPRHYERIGLIKQPRSSRR